MNDHLQKALATILEKAIQGIDTSVTFLTAQLPDVIQQLLLYKLVMSAIGFGVCILVLLFFLFLFSKVWKSFAPTTPGSNEAGCLALQLVALGLSMVLTSVVAADNLTWLKIWLAPKIFLIEYAASLIKQGTN